MYHKYHNPFKTVQTESIPGREDMVENEAGGFGFDLTNKQILDKFLILGTEGGTAYLSEKEISEKTLKRCFGLLQADHEYVLNRLAELSSEGRTIKPDPSLFLLALACRMDRPIQEYAWFTTFPVVVRTSTHLFQFVSVYKKLGGSFNRTARKAISNWYNSLSAAELGYQLIKYKSRHGFTHKDLITLIHLKPNSSNKLVLEWLFNETISPDLPVIIRAYEKAKTKKGESLREVIREGKLTWEMLPTTALKDPLIWHSLIYNLPMTALIRNLGRMTSIGALKTFESHVDDVANILVDEFYIKHSRVHPISVFKATRTYASGRGFIGKLTWNPNSKILDALEDCFYKSFANIDEIKNSVVIAIDCSGSMNQTIPGTPNISAKQAAAAVALIAARKFSRSEIITFDTEVKNLLKITKKTSLKELFGLHNTPSGTDISAPIRWTIENEIDTDLFLCITDGQTWAGETHVTQMLQIYQKKVNHPVRFIELNTAASHVTVADTKLDNMISICGFDSSVFKAVEQFLEITK